MERDYFVLRDDKTFAQVYEPEDSDKVYVNYVGGKFTPLASRFTLAEAEAVVTMERETWGRRNKFAIVQFT